MAQFQTTPNQRIISITGKEVCDKNNLYAKVNKKALLKAMKQLTPTNFEVWLYLASQQNNYTFAFSPSAIQEETGIKRSSLQEGVRVLIKEKYLIPRADNSNVYDFYELPREEPQEIQIQIHKEQEEEFNF